ncbi:MAG: immune inhibitor A [Candidatus Cloacimonetes bacterium]|nr:immune inhibitor A [Candidatus Cloacimonadota bacterium]
MKRIMIYIGLIVILLCSFSRMLDAQPLFTSYQSTKDYIEIEFVLDSYDFETIEVDGFDYQRITHPKASYLMEEGLPELPVFTTSIAVPATGRVVLTNITVLDSEIVNNYTIFPSQDFELEISKNVGFLKDEAFYERDITYPDLITEIVTPAVMRDIRFVSVAVTPFRYNPALEELEVNRHIRIKVEFDQSQQGENEISKPYRKLSRSFEKIYRSVFVNYEEFVDPAWEYQARSILVIYHHNSVIQPIVDFFVNWKRQKGFEITATNTQNLTTNTAIKNYIQNAYNTWEHPPEYVILIGGGSGTFSIPPFYAYPNYAGDHPYSLLEGDDNISDVFVGRLPFSNQEQLMTIWNKIKNYEKEPYLDNMNWYKNALLVGSPTGWGISTLFTPKYVKELMLLYDPDFTFSEVYYSPFPSQINAALNQGSFVFNYRGYYGFSNWSPNDPTMNNGLMMPYCFFLTCNTLNYSNNSETERMVNIGTPLELKGGIGAIGVNTLESKTAFNNALSGSFTYGIYNEGIRTLGETLVRGKIFLHQTYDTVHPSQPPQFSHWVNLMGDPSMDIWVNTPKEMNVAYEEVLPLGTNFIEVIVTDHLGLPLEDAWVTIRQGDDVIFATGYTDESGFITHFFNPDNTGEVLLTVTKPDYIPHLGSFTLSGEPAVTLYNVIVNSPINAGETISFLTNIKNYRDETVYNIAGSISTDTPYIEIINGTTSYGNIQAGAIAEGGEEFSISISLAAPNMFPVIFSLTLEDDLGNSWLSKFLFKINGNSLKPIGLIIADSQNYIEPGQTALMRMTIHNQGQLDIEEVFGILRTNNPLLDISDSIAYFENIEVGGTATSIPANSFTITAFDQFIPGMTVDLEVLFYNHLGYEALEPVTLQIGPISVNDPLGPCEYGYYIYGMEDTNYEFAPVYDWIEIAPQLGGNGVNTGLQSDYNNVQDFTAVNLPFTFKFYGVDYDVVTISANGWISFGYTQQGTYRNWLLPGPMGPNPIVAAFWDNLSLAQGGVYTYHDQDNDAFIIQWQNAQNFVGSAQETFQIILFNPDLEPTINDGLIKIQYKIFNNVNNAAGGMFGNWGNYCTVGIGDHTGNVGLTYTFANQYPVAAGVLTHESAIMIVGHQNYGEPLLVRQSVIVFDESESGYIDAGENVKLGIYLRNIGLATATNVSATINTTSPYINILHDSSQYYDIFPGTEEINREFFEFNVSAATDNNYTANMQINITTDNASFSFPFQLTISRPSLQIISYLIEEIEGNGNGIIEPGETVNLVLVLNNSSMTPVRNAAFSVESYNEYATVTTPNVIIGDVPSNTNLQKNISITFNEDCPVQEVIPLVINIDAENIIAYSRELYIGVAMEDIFIDFEDNDGGFASNNDSGWQWGEPSINPYSGEKVWATVLNTNYADSANWTLDSPSFLITPFSELIFQHNYNIEHYWDGGNIKISTDDGNSWQIVHPFGGYPVTTVNSGNSGIPNQPAYSGNSNGWQEATFDLQQYFGKQVLLRWHFGSGPWVNAPGWFIDDVMLSGANPLSATISGSVELNQSPFCVSNALITAGDYSVRPDIAGNYTLIVPAGNYTVSAHFPYHFTDVTHNFEISDLELIQNKDFSLQYLTPPENLELTFNEDDNSTELNWSYNPLPMSRSDDSRKLSREQQTTFSVFRQRDSGIFTLIANTTEQTFSEFIPIPQSIYRYYVVALYPEGNSDKSNTVSTDDEYFNIEEDDLTSPCFALSQNYPNPFNPVTNIAFSIPVQERVQLKIFNIKGELVKTLLDDILPAGDHIIQWNGVNNNNRPVSSGIYFYQIQAGTFRETRKALLLK